MARTEIRKSGPGALLKIGVPALVAVVGIVAVVMWLGGEPDVQGIEARVPGTARPASQGSSTPATNAQATAATGPTTSAPAGMIPTPSSGASAAASPSHAGATTSVPSIPGAWPNFRGSDYTNVSKERGLAKKWPAGGPRKLWTVNLGEGYAAAAVRNGRVYIIDYDENAKADTLRCLSLANGQQLWAQSYPVSIKRNHGISRTVPTVTDKYVISIGPMCHVMCCDATTGQVMWRKDLVAEWGTEVPPWYAGQCPLVDGNKVILGTGGKAVLIALDIASGNVIWQTPNPKGYAMTHASILPVKYGGTKIYVYPASKACVGVNASDGSLLWELPDWKVSTANIPMPIDMGGGKIFLCGGYGAGGAFVQLSGSGKSVKAKITKRLPAAIAGSAQQTYIYYNSHLYGVTPSKELSCLDGNGNQKWKSGTARFGLNAYMIADGMIYILSDAGELVMVKADSASYQEVARAKVLPGQEPWGPIALAGGRMIVRDMHTMVCLDVSGN